MSVVLRKAKSLWSHSTFVKIHLVPVWVGLGVAKVCISVISFRKLAGTFGCPVGPHAFCAPAGEWQEGVASSIASSVQTASRYTPWESNCFPQALVAIGLLRMYRIPYALFFGMNKRADNSGFNVHAWIHSGKVVVTGGRGFTKFVVVQGYIWTCDKR